MRSIFSALLAVGMLAAAGQASAQPGHARTSKAAAPGSCGENMYWRNGACEDARGRPSAKSWPEEMMAKKWAG